MFSDQAKKTKPFAIIMGTMMFLMFFGLGAALAQIPDSPYINQAGSSPCPEGEYQLNVGIGNLQCVKVGKDANPFIDYLRVWYGFIIGSVGILATGMIMYAGFKWLASRGNPTVIGDAKEKIYSAVIGLLLAFFSYTILYIINPELLTIKFDSSRLKPIQYSKDYEIGTSPTVTIRDGRATVNPPSNQPSDFSYSNVTTGLSEADFEEQLPIPNDISQIDAFQMERDRSDFYDYLNDKYPEMADSYISPLTNDSDDTRLLDPQQEQEIVNEVINELNLSPTEYSGRIIEENYPNTGLNFNFIMITANQ